MQIIERKRVDVCVIGSGPAGGWMTRALTEAGATVLLLEAGVEVAPTEFLGHKPPYAFPLRGTWDERQRPFYPDQIHRHIRYSGDPIGVDRIRVLGGRSIHWNAVSLRFSADDFREGAAHGIEPDWPLTYEELAPFYGEVERTIGVCGTKEGLPEMPDGEFYGPPMPMRCAERIAGKSCDALGMKLIPVRKAMRVGTPSGSRMPCHYCGHCMKGCDVGAIFTSVNTLLPLARATGRLTLRTNALVRRIEVDAEGRATGVSFVDRATGRDHTVAAGIVVVSCGSIESARLLLNSTSPRFPNGLANANDLVGRYLHGHTICTMSGYLKELMGRPPINDDGATDHSIVVRFNHRRGKKDYAGGFFAQVQYAEKDYPHHAPRVRGFGAGFKARVRELQPAMLQLGAFGKVVARHDNRVTVDPAKTDVHGIPIPVVHFTFGENDRALWKDMSESFEELFHKAGAELFAKETRLSGFASHEVGTCRMGRDPKTSVLDPFCRAHEVPNLFVVDGSPFVTFPEKNPTLTIMALALRTSRHIAGLRRRGEL
jgi:choline dehydrogenase-like flavoprotein